MVPASTDGSVGATAIRDILAPRLSFEMNVGARKGNYVIALYGMLARERIRVDEFLAELNSLPRTEILRVLEFVAFSRGARVNYSQGSRAC